jgi:hypothetical protein
MCLKINELVKWNDIFWRGSSFPLIGIEFTFDCPSMYKPNDHFYGHRLWIVAPIDYIISCEQGLITIPRNTCKGISIHFASRQPVADWLKKNLFLN